MTEKGVIKYGCLQGEQDYTGTLTWTGSDCVFVSGVTTILLVIPNVLL